jgi:phytoene synthase
VRTDAERGRVYLPREELERCQVRPEEILNFEYSARFCQAAARVAERARDFYRKARQTLPQEDRRSMGAAELMGSVYWRLLQKLEAQQFNVFDPALTRVSKFQKLFLIFRTWYRLSTGALVPNYGTP